MMCEVNNMNIEELEEKVKSSWEALQECNRKHDQESKPLRESWLESERLLKIAIQEKEVADLVAKEIARMQGCCND